MPLHLLGKKSWNVYNPENIARVRRDEAAAQAAEEAEEQRMQELDAARRLAILRGEKPPPLPEPNDDEKFGPQPTQVAAPVSGAAGPGRKKRKRPGEDDTDFEMRVAKERNEFSVAPLEPARKPTSSAPIMDHAGHIDLFGNERERAHAEKNKEAEEETRKKKREFEDQYTMRFSNAAGKGGGQKPWYSEADLAAAGDSSTKDVRGRDDAARQERALQRMAADDPLVMMKQATSRIRELKKEREKFQAEREAELKELRREERHREKRRRRHHHRETEHDGEEERRSEQKHRRSTDHRDDKERHSEGKRRHLGGHQDGKEKYSDRKRRHSRDHGDEDGGRRGERSERNREKRDDDEYGNDGRRRDKDSSSGGNGHRQRHYHDHRSSHNHGHHHRRSHSPGRRGHD